MNDPYHVLGLPPDAEPDAIRVRYLELVRQFSPEREPERFAEIREAFDKLRDPVLVLKNRLFRPLTAHTLDGLASRLRSDIRSRRIPTDILLSLARS